MGVGAGECRYGVWDVEECGCGSVGEVGVGVGEYRCGCECGGVWVKRVNMEQV